MNLQGRNLHQDLTGDDVRLLHIELALLNFVIPEAEQRPGSFGHATAAAVQDFQKTHTLPVTGIVDAVTARAINAAVDARRPPTSSVSGRVYSTRRAGIGRLQVQVLDKNAGPDVLLAEGVTTERGLYTVLYSTEALAARGKSAPDLQVRVLALGKPLGVSEVRYDASPTETLDVRVQDDAATALASEHETLTSAVRARFTGSLRDLQESGDRSDITYLANTTGWDGRAVVFAALAENFSEASGGTTVIPPLFFYALFRAGVPADEAVLYGTDTASLTSIWRNAIAQGVIPASAADQIPDVAKQFEALSVQRLLTGPPTAGVSSFRDLLDASRLSLDQKQQFATLYVAHRNDMPVFWNAVATTIGADAAKALQLDGKLASLTFNNVALMQALHQSTGSQPLTDPVQLAQAGYHRADKWSALLPIDSPIPPEISGETDAERRTIYTEQLAASIRLNFASASLAQMVKAGELPVQAPDEVHSFLTTHQDKFQIGAQPVQQYIKQQNVSVPAPVVAELKKMERVYQLTTSADVMGKLLGRGIESAAQVARQDRSAFIQSLAADVPAEQAGLVHDRSVQVHNHALNVAVSYITARNGFSLGAAQLAPNGGSATSSGQILNPAPTNSAADPAVIAYPTLETLFGSMDFCACDHCRSLLSPAAYLVDLLQFIDTEPTVAGKQNPQVALFARRPDIRHLPLTCQNTNTPLPYIDLVNETLEYFVANTTARLSLTGFEGHDTGAAATEDLMASPQNVIAAAYETLETTFFPSPLPFHRSLEELRLHFDKLEVPLPLAMERLRRTDDVDRGTNPYGWHDILMEELRLSREEYGLLTDGSQLTLAQIYGFTPGIGEADVISALSNAKMFARRVGVSYEDLVAILKTRFVSPNSDLIPKLERLGVSFSKLHEFQTGTLTPEEFDDLLPQGARAPRSAEYGGDVKKWVKDPANALRIMSLITLTGPAAATAVSDFGQFELRYSKPSGASGPPSNRLVATDFVRLLRFIRLWRKLGWAIEHVDAALCALFRADAKPVTAADLDALPKLDAGFSTLLPRLGVAVRVLRALHLTPKRDLLPLLACWSDMDTHGGAALYRQLFLNPVVLVQDPAFADDGYGNFPAGSTDALLDHGEGLRAALSLTADELTHIVDALGFDDQTPLTLSNITAIYRRSWLRRQLHLSVRELLLLSSLAGIDPFAAPDPPLPSLERWILLVQSLKARSLRSEAALYLIWNQDVTGRSAPTAAQVNGLVRTLRGDFAAIDEQFSVVAVDGGDLAKARVALVYGQETTDRFFALLEGTVVLNVEGYTPAATDPADGALAYDRFQHRLSHTGLLTDAERVTLKALPGVSTDFRQAVDSLYLKSQDILGSFLGRFPELQPIYDAYVASTASPEEKQAALLATFSPDLARRRKRDHALQALATAASVDLVFAQALLAPREPAPFPLHAAGHATLPAVDDITAVQTQGLLVSYYHRDTATGARNGSVLAASNLAYSVASNPLPANSTAGAPISGIWQGRLEAPETGYFNLLVETDLGATVSLWIDGQDQEPLQTGKVWRNRYALQLKAGVLYDVTVTVAKVRDALSIQWETPKRAREVIPGRYLYPPHVFESCLSTYVRFLKVAALATTLRLTGNEVVYLAKNPYHFVDGQPWLNALSMSGTAAPQVNAALVKPLESLLDFARIKAELSPDDEQLLTILKNPAVATASADSLLLSLARWNKASLLDLLVQFGTTIDGLSDFGAFQRVYDAFGILQKLGISTATALRTATNAPTPGVASEFESALRARYDAGSWREVVKPLHDTMRSLQRDALVAHILHQMRSNPDTAAIDTPDKLFEYFLMDVEMEPCMQTSRVRHALSTLQLFIERCCMNLEADVSPSSIDRKRWDWMKRYRVWEANRKVFLYPENWLEPELRDDKSPFFKEIESLLLQSDITEESATSAFLTYLSRLEEVAKLEPCGMHYVEPTSNQDAVMHVVARTAGAHRKYYYRRLEHGTWTAWDPIKLDISDNPVVPVVWQDRLFLFWLKLLKKGPDVAQKPSGTTHLAQMEANAIPDDPLLKLQAVLCWSEYYNGTWQAAKTSDINAPANLHEARLRELLTPEGIRVAVYAMDDSALRIGFMSLQGPPAYLIHNTHSLPLLDWTPGPPPGSRQREDLTQGPRRLPIGFNYIAGLSPPTFRSIPRPSFPHDASEPRLTQLSHELTDAWSAPFFYEDRHHVFLVTTEQQPVWIRDLHNYGLTADVDLKTAQAPALVLPEPPAPRPRFSAEAALSRSNAGATDPTPMRRLITEDAYIHQGLPTTAGVLFNGRLIGPTGAVETAKTREES